MKKIISSALLAIFYLEGSAQEPAVNNRIPSSAQQQFNNMYTGSTNSQWWVKNNTYQVSFIMNNVRQQVNYDSSGAMIYTGVEIKPAELPPGVTESFKSAYANRTMMEVYKIDRKGIISYMVKLDGTPVTRLYFDVDGKLVTNKIDNW